MSATPPRIGLSACFFHPDPQRNIFKGKTLAYCEQSMAHYVMTVLSKGGQRLTLEQSDLSDMCLLDEEGLDRMVEGVANDVHQRIHELFDDQLVELCVCSR